VNRIFAIPVRQLSRREGWSLAPRIQFRVIAMRTLRRIQAVSLRVAPQWFLCVFLGAYLAMQMVTSHTVLG